MIVVQVFLPHSKDPVDLASYVDFVIAGGSTGDDRCSPDYLQFDTPECGVEAVKDPVD